MERKEYLINKIVTKSITTITLCAIVICYLLSMKITTKADSGKEITVDATLGTTYSGTLEEYGDTYYYNIVLPTSGRLNVSVEGYCYVNILDKYDNHYVSIYNHSDFSLDMVSGEYVIFVEYANRVADFTMTTMFTTANETYKESYTTTNNIVNNATNISPVGFQITGQFAENDNVDIYKFKIKESKDITFKFESNLSRCSICLYDIFEEYKESFVINDKGITSKTFTLPAGTYYIKMDSYLQNFVGATIGYTTGIYKFSIKAKDITKTSIKSVKNVKTRKIKISWKRKSNVSGYQVMVATDSKFKKNKKTYTVDDKAKSSFTTTNKLKKGKTYYVRIRTYKFSENGVKCYSGWSKAKKVKIKK
jgi:hypothetical protein